MESSEQIRKFRNKAFLYAVISPIAIFICFFIVAIIISTFGYSLPKNGPTPGWFELLVFITVVLILLCIVRGLYFFWKLIASLYSCGRREVSRRLWSSPTEEENQAIKGQTNVLPPPILPKSSQKSPPIDITSKNLPTQLSESAGDEESADSLISLANAYYQGDGVAQDYRQALRCYLKAADEADPSVHGLIGWMYEKGMGVEKDLSKALMWYQKAADRGDASAQYHIGWMYQHGLGVAKDYSQALIWHLRAADQGHPGSQGLIGVMYKDGLGVAKDYGTALAWFQKAAEQGNPDSQRLSGVMYEKGLGTAKDTAKALEWYNKAAQQGDSDSIEALERLGEKPQRSAGTPIQSSTPEEILAELDKLIGIQTVKAELHQTIQATRAMVKRREAGHPVEPPSYHTIFTGSPGTGKTTVARLMGQAYHSLGILKRGHVVEVSRSDLVGKYVGDTAPRTRKKLEEALDGILFVDEAYTLSKSADSTDFGTEAINEILQFMENHRNRLIVIAAGYEDQMIGFINANPGLQSRFNKFIKFEDLGPTELASVFDGMCTKGNYRLASDFKIRMLLACHEMYEKRDEKFGNARDVRKLFERCQNRYLARTSSLVDSNPPMIAEDLDFKDKAKIEDILQGQPEFVIYCPRCNKEILWSPDPPVSTICSECEFEFPSGWGLMRGSTAYNSLTKQAESKQSLAELLAELDGMTGLASVKIRIKQLVDSVKIQQVKRRRGLPAGVPISLHMIFAGSPGTGKTTVARLVGKIFHAMGLLSKGHFVEVDRSNLVGSYIGQTEKITSEKLDEAMDGILFIDEAYSLTSQDPMGSDFGRRAIETLLKRMEDSRDRLVVIAAGYQDDIKSFLESNPGLASRFATHVLFEDYTSEELLYITDHMASASKLSVENALRQKIYDFFVTRYEQRNKAFSNARLARNLLETICMLQTSRISHQAEILSDDEFQTLKVDDWPDDKALASIH